MKKASILIAAMVTLGAVNHAAGADIRVISPSIIAIGEPMKVKEVKSFGAIPGFVPTVPPVPGTPVKQERPKIVSNPPIPADASKNQENPETIDQSEAAPAVSSEKTAAVGVPAAASKETENESRDLNLGGMEMRLE